MTCDGMPSFDDVIKICGSYHLDASCLSIILHLKLLHITPPIILTKNQPSPGIESGASWLKVWHLFVTEAISPLYESLHTGYPLLEVEFGDDKEKGFYLHEELNSDVPYLKQAPYHLTIYPVDVSQLEQYLKYVQFEDIPDDSIFIFTHVTREMGHQCCHGWCRVPYEIGQFKDDRVYFE